MYPFTSSQWRELEQQALVFKYLSYNLPIPSDLISQIKQSFLLSLSIGPSPTTFPSLSPPDAWGSLHTGFGRRREDLQPGRCRRTDGKKWRCSKETTGDSKYCERHMHRGKNRSRKLVELSLATTCTPNVHHNQYQRAFSPYKNPNPVENENIHKDGENGFWFMSESNDLKIEKVALDLSTEIKQSNFNSEKPRAFHCFFD